MTYILGLDVGSKTIGVAKISVDNEITTPVLTLKRQSVKKDVARIRQMCVEMVVTEIVVGLPIQLDGQEGRSAKLARQIGSGLEEQNLTVYYQDERFSTVEAQQRMIEAGKSASKRKKSIDAAAACVILEHFLQSKNLKNFLARL